MTSLEQLNSSKIKLAIADDHDFLRDGLKLLFGREDDIELVGDVKNGLEIVELVQSKPVDVVVMDIDMPLMNGIEATRTITIQNPSTKIVALSFHSDYHPIMDMLQAGASGYVVKGAGKDELLEAVRLAHIGENYYCRTTAKELMNRVLAGNFKPYEQFKVQKEFSSTEIEVMIKICEELTSKQIAHALDMNLRTVEGIRSRIMQKLNVKSNIGVVIYAIQNGIYKL